MFQRLLLIYRRETAAEGKPSVSRPNESTLLGFTFLKTKSGWEIWIADKSVGRSKEKCKGITSRSKGTSEKSRIDKLQRIINGWVTYFLIAKAKGTLQDLDRLVRSRLRMCRWKAWKQAKTRVQELVKLGFSGVRAYKCGNSSKGYCRVAYCQILQHALPNRYFTRQGYTGFYNTYNRKTGAQPSLF